MARGHKNDASIFSVTSLLEYIRCVMAVVPALFDETCCWQAFTWGWGGGGKTLGFVKNMCRTVSREAYYTSKN
jgi:hypothetical protein